MMTQVLHRSVPVTGQTVTVLAGSHGHEVTTGVSELLSAASSFAREMSLKGIGPGDRIAILMPMSPQVVPSILATWMAGAAFSVLPSAVGEGGSKSSASRVGQSLAVLAPKLVLASPQTIDIACQLVPAGAEVMCLKGTEWIGSESREPYPDSAAPKATDLAFVQFTSGSTNIRPRGVMIRHGQLADNIEGIGEKISVRADDVMVSWAPLHHDMGLLALLLSLYNGLSAILIPTESFGRRPSLWLETIGRFRGTLSPAPPFAFQLLAKRPATRGTHLDLSSWRYAWIGGEPIFAEQVRSFERVYAPAGLQPNVLQPTYGLAESVVAVASGRAGEPLPVVIVDGRALREIGRVVPCNFEVPDAVEIIGCGEPNLRMEVRIVGEDGGEAAAGIRGRILIRGPSVTEGYLDQGPLQDDDGWVDTGDLGFMLGADLFVFGRTKELVKRGGVGVAPQDIEWVVESFVRLHTGRTAAFSVLRPDRGREEVVVLIEDHPTKQSDHQLIRLITAAVATEVGIQVDNIRFVGRGGIPRTSSGKLRRGRAHDIYVEGGYDASRPGPEPTSSD